MATWPMRHCAIAWHSATPSCSRLSPLRCRLRRNMGVKPASLLFYVKGIHYAWVTLGIAMAMRLVSSVERTASGVLVAYLVDPAGEFGWSRSMAGTALSMQRVFSGVFG